MKGLSRESRLLIDAARDGDEPSAADRKRVRTSLARKLAVGAAAGVVAATATHAAAGGVAAAGTSGTAAGAAVTGAAGGASAGGAAFAVGTVVSSFGAKLLVSVAIVGAMSAGTVGYVRHEAGKRANAQLVAAERALAASTPPAKSTPSPSLPSTPKADPPSAPAVAAQKPAPLAKPLPGASSPPLTAAAPSDLDVEIALLQEAHGALRMNDGARALRLLDEHTRRFPNGALAEESEAARVFALRQVGRADEARDVAARFLREHPRSPLAQRVTRAFDPEPPTF